LGNPFFVEELCVSLSGSDALAWQGEFVGPALEITSLELPESVQSVLRGRMDRLEPHARETLRLAAVIGREFSRELLARIAPDSGSIDARLTELMRQGFVLPNPKDAAGGYRFKHVTTQEVAYDSLLRRRRASIHRRVAEGIQSLDRDGRLEEHYETLAAHYLAAGDDDEAIHFLRLAATKATGHFAMHQAREHYRRAIACSQKLGDDEARARERIDLILHYAATCPWGPSLDQISVLDRGAQEARRLGDDAAALRVQYWICWVLYSVGEHRRAIDATRQVVESVRPLGSEGVTGSFLCHLGNCVVISRDFDQGETLFEEGIAMRRRHAATTNSALGETTVYALSQYALMLADRGDPARRDHVEADRHLALALDTVEEIGMRPTESSVRITLAFIAALREDWKEARDSAIKARAPAQAMLAPYHLATCDTIEGQAAFHLGDHEAGIAAMRRGLEGIERCGLPLTLTWSLACLAEALALRGGWGEAERLARAAIDRGSLLDRLGEDIAQRTLFRIAVQRNPTIFESEAATLLELSDASGSPRSRALAKRCILELSP
jgi:tetratricopeptide (TPR) repeat protein